MPNLRRLVEVLRGSLQNWWRWRDRFDRDLDDEIRDHLEREIADRIALGLSPQDARDSARRDFGNVTLVKEIAREGARSTPLERLIQDVRFAARTFRRTPVLTGVIVLTLALGVGATTAVFSIVQAVLLRPLPYRSPERLVAIWDGHVREPRLAKVFASYTDFETWKQYGASFEQMAALTWATGEQVLTGRGPAKVVLAIPATEDLFSLLDVRAEIGRTFQPDDRQRACSVVLAHHFWRDTFGARLDAVGQSVTLDQRVCSIVGVMPPTFQFFPSAADMWRLVTHAGDGFQGGVAVVGRLKPGVSLDTAQRELAALHQHAGNDEVHRRSFGPSVYRLQEEFTWLAGRNLRLTLVLLFVAVMLVLLIACVNVANLLLGRSVARQREFAIRAALGAGQVRLLRQLLTEGLLLAAAGAALGTVLAALGIHYLRTAHPVELPAASVVTVDLHVLGFTAMLSVLTALLVGLGPAWGASRTDVIEFLKSGGRLASADPRLHKFSKAFVVAEMSCSVVLLVGAGLLIESVGRLSSTPLGFNPANLLTMTVRLPGTNYGDPAVRAGFYDRLLLAATAVPALDGAAVSTSFLRGGGSHLLAVRGRPEPSPELTAPDVLIDAVSVDYFKVLGIPQHAGRGFEDRDREGAEAVAIVNETLARKYFPPGQAIGHYVRYGSDPSAPWLLIVGVVGNQKGTNVHQEMSWVDVPLLFRPLQQTAPGQATLIVRTSSVASGLGRSLQLLVAALDPDVPVSNLLTVQDHIAKTLAYPTFRARLLGAFASLALLLAVAGLYGVLAQLVGQRRQEIGIRLALGAPQRAILALVAKQGALLAGTGLVCGLVMTLWLGRFLQAMLYDIHPTDVTTLALTSLVLGLAASAAVYVPVRRALHTDPNMALRHD